MHVLALSPFHGGSHQAFLDGWRRASRHEFTILSLPARHWKWRMRHAAVAFADQLAESSHLEPFDALFVTDMLNLAEFRGLAPDWARRLPTVAYFHENQLTYPTRLDGERVEWDHHFAFTNFTTALAADAVWFNSAYHRDVFLSGLAEWLPKLPDYQPTAHVDEVGGKSVVQSPGIEPFPRLAPRKSANPLHIVWAARWEHDKDPETFFAALNRLQAERVDFRLSVLGESFSNVPECFRCARESLIEHIVHWGWLESRREYRAALMHSDVFVSTARHEFFGIAAAEAIAAGCYPLLPNRLAYPELVGGRREFLYDGTAESLCSRMGELASLVKAGTDLADLTEQLTTNVQARFWVNRADEMDAAIESLECVRSGARSDT